MEKISVIVVDDHPLFRRASLTWRTQGHRGGGRSAGRAGAIQMPNSAPDSADRHHLPGKAVGSDASGEATPAQIL